MKILNYGSLNLDFVYSVDRIVIPGETISSNRLQVFCGGKGLNQSVALARAGAEVYHAGAVGEDGGQLVDICRENGVDTSLIRTVSERSGNAMIQVSADGQNCIVLFGGANQCQTRESIDEALTRFEAGDMLLVQNEVNLVEYMIDQAAAKKMLVAFNPSPYDKRILSCDFNKVNIFIVNEVEGEQITGKKDPKEILERMQSLFPASAVVLTLGSEGAVYQDSRQRVHQPATKVDVVDTTAAGDTFLGYFLAGLLRKEPVPLALHEASVASSLAVSRMGATTSIPVRKEVLATMKNSR